MKLCLMGSEMVALPEGILTRPALASLQTQRLGDLLEEILPHHRFYARKLTEAGVTRPRIQSLEDIRQFPFTTKVELCDDQLAHLPYGQGLTYPLTCYHRLHQTSGTS